MRAPLQSASNRTKSSGFSKLLSIY